MSNLGMSNQQIISIIDEKVAERIAPHECIVVYSAYDTDEWDKPIDNLDEIPVRGNVQIVTEDEEYKSIVLQSPTWLDITVVANEFIKLTMDYQKKYLKDVEVLRNENGVIIASLIMGDI